MFAHDSILPVLALDERVIFKYEVDEFFYLWVVCAHSLANLLLCNQIVGFVRVEESFHVLEDEASADVEHIF